MNKNSPKHMKNITRDLRASNIESWKNENKTGLGT